MHRSASTFSETPKMNLNTLLLSELLSIISTEQIRRIYEAYNEEYNNDLMLHRNAQAWSTPHCNRENKAPSAGSCARISANGTVPPMHSSVECRCRIDSNERWEPSCAVNHPLIHCHTSNTPAHYGSQQGSNDQSPHWLSVIRKFRDVRWGAVLSDIDWAWESARHLSFVIYQYHVMRRMVVLIRAPLYSTWERTPYTLGLFGGPGAVLSQCNVKY